MSPFDPYMARWVKVSSHLNPNSYVYFCALGETSKSLKMFGHLGHTSVHTEFVRRSLAHFSHRKLRQEKFFSIIIVLEI